MAVAVDFHPVFIPCIPVEMLLRFSWYLTFLGFAKNIPAFSPSFHLCVKINYSSELNKEKI